MPPSNSAHVGLVLNGWCMGTKQASVRLTAVLGRVQSASRCGRPERRSLSQPLALILLALASVLSAFIEVLFCWRDKMAASTTLVFTY